MDLLYITRMLLQYGFIFLMTYYVVILSPKIQRVLVRSLVSGSLLGCELILISLLQEQLAWKDLSNGRNFFVVFAMTFWGPIATLPIAIAVMFVSLMYSNLYIAQDLLIFALVFLVSYGFRMYIKKLDFSIRWYHILFISVVPVLLTLPLANFLYRGEVAVKKANDSVFIILSTLTILNYAVFYVNFRERERRKNLARIQKANVELESQNVEIRALYEEMAASEEALHENYLELEEHKNKLEYLAYHDSKTGLLNRDSLVNKLNEINQNRLTQKILIYIRIHDIERLIDTVGQTLIEILHSIMSKNLSEALRRYEHIHLYHIAQGRYALFLDGEQKHSVALIIEEVLDRLKEIQLIENIYFPIDLDLGAIELDKDQEEAALWLEWAEVAMVESSKMIERNHLVWFTKEMHDKKQYQNRLEFDIQQAIKRRELYIVLQPQYTITKEVIGAEVLLRWEHKEFGLVSPQIFIPLAEKLGLINNIGRFVLEQAIEVIRKMKETNKKVVPISINTSMLELLDMNFSKNLLSKIEENTINSDSLTIEITESAIVEDLQTVKNNIEAMLEAGIHLHLDDFGTGYSSLSHLSRLPVSHVKVDKSFVNEMLINERSLQVVKTIIELVHRLDMHVIAEGVERIEQLENLDRLGCDYYQGYYFSKPVSKEAFFNILSKL